MKREELIQFCRKLFTKLPIYLPEDLVIDKIDQVIAESPSPQPTSEAEGMTKGKQVDVLTEVALLYNIVHVNQEFRRWILRRSPEIGQSLRGMNHIKAIDDAEKALVHMPRNTIAPDTNVATSPQPSATAEEFIREKIRQRFELKGDMMGLWCYSLNGEDALRWAHEYAAKPVAEREVSEEWISVKDRLPERNQNVLIAREKPFHTYLLTAFQRDGVFHSNQDAIMLGKVTHWMPLPKPPVK